MNAVHWRLLQAYGRRLATHGVILDEIYVDRSHGEALRPMSLFLFDIVKFSVYESKSLEINETMIIRLNKANVDDVLVRPHDASRFGIFSF